MSTKKSLSIKKLEKMRGGPLTFGRMIESIRKADEMSQVELASLMKISKAHLCDIEKGRRSVSLSRAADFAEILDYSPIVFVSILIEDMVREAGLAVKVSLKAA